MRPICTQVASLQVQGPRYWARTHDVGLLQSARAGGSQGAGQCHAVLQFQIQPILSLSSHPSGLQNACVQVASLQVQGPRYWAHTHDVGLLQSARAGGPQDAAQGSAALFVRRKTGAMPYEADPRGVRSLLSRAAHLVSACMPSLKRTAEHAQAQEAAQGSAALFMRHKMGAMPYEAGPRGVRSLLSRAAHLTSSSVADAAQQIQSQDAGVCCHRKD